MSRCAARRIRNDKKSRGVSLSHLDSIPPSIALVISLSQTCCFPKSTGDFRFTGQNANKNVRKSKKKKEQDEVKRIKMKKKK